MTAIEVVTIVVAIATVGTMLLAMLLGPSHEPWAMN